MPRRSDEPAPCRMCGRAEVSVEVSRAIVAGLARLDGWRQVPGCCLAADIEESAKASGLAYIPTWATEDLALPTFAPTFHARIAPGPIGIYAPRVFEIVARVLAWAPGVECRKAWRGVPPCERADVAENRWGGVAEWIATLDPERVATILATHDLAADLGDGALSIGRAVLPLLNEWGAVSPRPHRSRGEAA